jgi:hypothetical protein
MNKFSKISDIKARRKAFIEDEAAFYNSNNRAEFMGSCSYHPTNNSPGCAIGRHLDRDSEIFKLNIRGAIDTIIEERGGECIPTWMLEMGKDFLFDCQSLHDISIYWNEKGLTKWGRSKMSLIVEEWC